MGGIGDGRDNRGEVWGAREAPHREGKRGQHNGPEPPVPRGSRGSLCESRAMSTSRGGKTPAEALEGDLLARLGLGTDTTPEQIATTHDAVVGFLAGAPRDLRGWARSQAAAADEAYALLSDPAALARCAALAEPAGRPALRPDGPAATPARRAASPNPLPERPPTARDEQMTADDELDELIAAVTPSAHRDEVQRPRTRPKTAGDAVPRKGRLIPVRRLVVVAGLVASALAIAFIGYNLGGGGTPVTAATTAVGSAAPSPSLDTAKVASLMATIQANPNDKNALMGLGDAFFAAGQYDVAAQWLAKLVKIDPQDTQALLALGAADYNNGNATDAETYWKQVVDLDPRSVEAHYDLGFLYLQESPPDMAGVQSEWQKVVQLAPGTQVAQNVQAHLDALASAAPSGSASAAPTAPPVASAPASPPASSQP